MACPWSRGTAVYLRVGEQGTVWGQARSAVCRERLTRVSHFCVQCSFGSTGAAPSCGLLGLFPDLAGQDPSLCRWGWCWSWQCSVRPSAGGAGTGPSAVSTPDYAGAGTGSAV